MASVLSRLRTDVGRQHVLQAIDKYDRPLLRDARIRSGKSGILTTSTRGTQR